jgi:hypothetical protein
MQFYILFSFLAMFFGVYGDQQYSAVLLRRGIYVSGLHERQTDTCDAGYFACPTSLGGGCCPDGTTCTTDDATCQGGLTTCTGSGQEICGDVCCDYPLVCSGSMCVDGGSPAPAPAPVSVPAPAPTPAPAPAPAPAHTGTDYFLSLS